MTQEAFPNAKAVYVGTYKGVKYYTYRGTIQFLLGWMPIERQSIRAAKLKITKWTNGE